MDSLRLIAHPVRLRILHAMAGGAQLTVSELRRRLGDVPPASVYRHVTLLVDGGVLEVTDEVRVRGAVERRYRLSEARATIDRERAEAMSLEEHREAFMAAISALVAEFEAYLAQSDARPGMDRVGYRQIPLQLAPNEVAALVGEMSAVLAAFTSNAPDPARRTYLLSPILFPIDPPAGPVQQPSR